MELSYSSTDIALLRMVTRNIFKAVPDRFIILLTDPHHTIRGLTGCLSRRWVQFQKFRWINKKYHLHGIARRSVHIH